ncbi:MAG: sensor histidine kinase [Eubacteriales bacterium]
MKIRENEDLHLLRWYLIISICAVIMTVILSYVSVQVTSLLVRDTYASIVGSLVQKYPEDEEEIIRNIKNIQVTNKEVGYEILNNYNLSTIEEVQGVNMKSGIFIKILTSYLLFQILTLISFLMVIYFHIKKKSLLINDITGYFKRINKGDYSLDIRDNNEGDISILKNEIYKTTIMLKEKEDKLRNERNNLSNSISDISHQLKTPLTSMNIVNDLLYEDLPMDKKKIFLNKNQAQLERMQWLVTALLNIAKIDAGTIIFKKEKINIQDILQESISQLEEYMGSKEIIIQYIGDEQAHFYGDYYWSLEGMVNILKNCIDHSSQKGELILDYNNNSLYSSIMISDHGMGIAMEDLPYIFNRFYKGKNAGKDSVGIGLSLAKMIFEQQNGDIQVDSILGQGTCFTIKIYK